MRKNLLLLLPLVFLLCSYHLSIEDCGLSGVILLPKERGEKEIRFVKELAKELLLATQPRGDQATGVVMFYSTKKTEVLKSSGDAVSFVKRKTFKEFIDKFDKDVVIILGHNRLPSRGDVKDNKNNQPIKVKTIAGIHNGVITNHTEIFKEHKLERIGENDSEAIFALLAEFGKDSISQEVISKCVNELEGTLTFIVADEREPDKCWFVKKDMPLSIVKIPALELVAFDSEMTYLRKALKKASKTAEIEIPKTENIKFPANSGLLINCKDGKITKFDPFSKEK
jgi:glucosamine 6-phosphate synthetase-like amidotransferase/phosphosugar isomerase protein